MDGEWVGACTVGRAPQSVVHGVAGLGRPKARSLAQSLPVATLREARDDALAGDFDPRLPHNDRVRERSSCRFRTKGTDAVLPLQTSGRDRVAAAPIVLQWGGARTS